MMTLQQAIYTVSQLNSEARALLETAFTQIWVEGEISNFAAPHSGHWYFSLKDEKAQIRCAMFRNSQQNLGFTPKNGAQVLVRARVSMYEARGEYQLIADFMEERGEGKLRRAFEALKKKLETAGLFDEKYKKPIPIYPKQIGVITSATGAAIRDILTVLQRRCPHVPVIIYPTLVQGAAAAPAIVSAIQLANQHNQCDVLILARGGGSLEDLWPFNEEIVAQAIFQSQLPLISGVGHEVDFTIADFVADIRAPTPSVAAEMATLDKADLLLALKRDAQRITRQVQLKLTRDKQQLDWLEKHLAQQHPKRKLAEKMQQLDLCELKFTQLQTKLITHYQTTLAKLAGKLDVLSPLATLHRGFAIASKDKKIISDIHEIKIKDHIHIRLVNGEMDCVVMGIEK